MHLYRSAVGLQSCCLGELSHRLTWMRAYDWRFRNLLRDLLSGSHIFSQSVLLCCTLCISFQQRGRPIFSFHGHCRRTYTHDSLQGVHCFLYELLSLGLEWWYLFFPMVCIRGFLSSVRLLGNLVFLSFTRLTLASSVEISDARILVSSAVCKRSKALSKVRFLFE